jgi:hypothetical protein
MWEYRAGTACYSILFSFHRVERGARSEETKYYYRLSLLLRLSTRLEAATSKRCGESEDTQLRQRDKAKATIPHGDDAEAQESPQHTVGSGDSAVIRESVRTLSSYNATKPRRQSPTVTTPRHKSRLSTRLEAATAQRCGRD